MLEFIKEIQESRMTRSAKNQRMLTYEDCKERAYLMLLCLQTMRYYRDHRNNAARYAYRTVMFRDYTRHRVDTPDLYNLIYFITGDETALGKLKDPGSAAKSRRATFLSVGKLNGFLRNISDNQKPGVADYNFLIKLEDELGIRNSHYKEIRRRLSSYEDATKTERQTAITRLLFAVRSKLSDSDIITMFTALTLDKNLENQSLTSPEPELSVPDVVATQDVQNYRFLVQVTKLPFIAKFLENAKGGKTVIANFVQAYLPIIIMVDDIVKAGPAYIEQLKQLHKRAKRARK